MFLNCDLQAPDSYQLYCTMCTKPIDVVDSDCVRWLLERNETPCCMDCDGYVADMYFPNLFARYWEYTWQFLHETTGNILMVEFSPKTGLIEASVILVDKDHWFSKAMIEGRYACSVKQYFKPQEKDVV